MTKPLTPAQKRTVRAMVEHGCYDDAAQALRRKRSTLMSHMKAVRFRLGTSSDMQIAVIAEREGWLQGVEV